MSEANTAISISVIYNAESGEIETIMQLVCGILRINPLK